MKLSMCCTLALALAAASSPAQVSITLDSKTFAYGQPVTGHLTNNSSNDYWVKSLFPGMIFQGTTLVFPIFTSQLYFQISAHSTMPISWSQQDSYGFQVAPGNYRWNAVFYYGTGLSQTITKSATFNITPPRP